MTLQIGDKVRNVHSNLEGVLVYSSFGASVAGVKKDKQGKDYRFQTLGEPLVSYEKDWERVKEFEYNMRGHGEN